MTHLRDDLPTTVTIQQLTTVCDILGLPADDVATLHADGHHGVHAELYHRSPDGHLIAGYDDEPLTSHHYLTLSDELPRSNDLRTYDITTHDSPDTEILIPDDMKDALTKLGWTPPTED